MFFFFFFHLVVTDSRSALRSPSASDDAFTAVWRVSVPVREGGEPTGVEGLEEKLLFVWSGE